MVYGATPSRHASAQSKEDETAMKTMVMMTVLKKENS
jgi:hypothetical protein